MPPDVPLTAHNHARQRPRTRDAAVSWKEIAINLLPMAGAAFAASVAVSVFLFTWVRSECADEYHALQKQLSETRQEIRELRDLIERRLTKP